MADKCKFEVRQVEALREPDGGWTWNESFRLGEFTTTAEDQCKAFMNYLRKIGFRFKRGSVVVDDAIDVLEVQDKKTGEPLFAALWIWEGDK